MRERPVDRPRLACFLARALVVGRALRELPEATEPEERAAYLRRRRWSDQVADGLRLADVPQGWIARVYMPAFRNGGTGWAPGGSSAIGTAPAWRDVFAVRLAVVGDLLAIVLAGDDIPEGPGNATPSR